MEIYEVRKKDIRKAGAVLAEAFQHDPVWEKVLANATFEQKRSFFESPVRYGMMYGNACASSLKLEGIAVWVTEKYADITIGRGLRSGSLWSSMKVGMRNLYNMMPVFDPLESDRNKNMSGKKYLYLLVIGVLPEFRGQGFASSLINGIIQDSENSGVPIYLETSTQKNIEMYQHFGFKIIGKIMQPVIDLPQWEMLREPG